MKYKIPLAILGIIVIVAFFRWNSLNAPFERDEGEYAYSARVLLDGGLPYQDSFTQKPPMIIYTYALGGLIDRDAVWPPRILAALSILGIALFAGWIVKKEYNENAGILAAFIVVPMLSFPYLAALAANTEIFMLLPLMAAVLIFVLNREKKLSAFGPLFWAGFLAGAAILFKPIALLPLLFLFGTWLWQIWQKEKNLKKVLLGKVFIISGILASLFLFLGYFLIRDGGKSFLENVVIYNSYYLDWVNQSSGIFFREMLILLAKWSPLWILLAVFFFVRPKNWWFYLGLFLASMLMIFRASIGHYYLILMPFWAIIAAAATFKIASHFEKKWGERIVFGVTVILLLFMLKAVNGQFEKTPSEMSVWIYGVGNPFIEAKIAGQKLSEITAPADQVFVAGSEPEILFYANRKSVSRFIITYPFVIDTPTQLAYQKEAISELQKNPPRAIVLSQREESGLWNKESPLDFKNFLFELLKNKYQLLGGFVWDQNGGAWRENLSNQEISEASLLLYRIN